MKHVLKVVLHTWPGRNKTFLLLNNYLVEADPLKLGLIPKSGYPCQPVNITASSRELPPHLEILPDCHHILPLRPQNHFVWKTPPRPPPTLPSFSAISQLLMFLQWLLPSYFRKQAPFWGTIQPHFMYAKSLRQKSCPNCTYVSNCIYSLRVVAWF